MNKGKNKNKAQLLQQPKGLKMFLKEKDSGTTDMQISTVLAKMLASPTNKQ